MQRTAHWDEVEVGGFKDGMNDFAVVIVFQKIVVVDLLMVALRPPTEGLSATSGSIAPSL